MSQGGDQASIIVNTNSVEIGQVVLVTCVRSLKEQTNNAEYILEDGTGSITGRCWLDRMMSPVQYSNTKSFFITLNTFLLFRVGQWARIYGSLRSLKESRTLNIFSIRPIGDHNDVTLHFLQVLQLNMPSVLFHSLFVSFNYCLFYIES